MIRPQTLCFANLSKHLEVRARARVMGHPASLNMYKKNAIIDETSSILFMKSIEHILIPVPVQSHVNIYIIFYLMRPLRFICESIKNIFMPVPV